MNAHQDALKERCRLCGINLRSRPSAMTPVGNIIQDALGIDVSEDDVNIHPPFICGGCLRKLQRWKKGQSKKAKAVPLNITAYPFGPHDEACTTCLQLQVQPDLKTIVANRARDFEELTVHTRSDRVLVVELDNNGNTKKALTVKEGGLWNVRAYGRSVDKERFSDIPCQLHVTEESDVIALLKQFVMYKVCTGNEFSLTDAELEGKPAYRHHCPDSSTIRYRSCPLLTDKSRCGPCSIYRSTLAAVCKSTDQPSTSQNTPYRYLPRKEVEDRLRKAHGTVKSMKKKISKLEDRIAKWVRDEGQELPPDQTKSFKSILTDEQTIKYFSSLPEDSPQKIMFEQQKQSASSHPTRMRWHPALLRLCIALHSKSSSAYNLIRSSGFLNLPHQNTLRNYTHFTDTSPGINEQLIKLLISEQDLSNQPEYKRNVCLLMDEMKIKTGLIFSSGGRLVGFRDLDDVSNELKHFENTLNGQKTKLASHVFVLMVRGLLSNMKAPFAYFPCESMSCDELYPCVWGGIKVLEKYGLRVRAVTSDGASANRKFYEMCRSGNEHWTWNPFDKTRKVYFLSDPPHLIKTVRNNFANSGSHTKTRNLMFHGKKITWLHILNLYEWDIASGSGLRKLYKISTDHLHLTPTSRMRVSLAAQVLSSTVANALDSQNLAETESTRIFIRMIDLFFDCLNVSNVTDCKKKRKISLEPYRSSNDWRFTFLEEDFLSFINEWESEGRLVEGLSRAERGKLHLSKATFDGLTMTVKSFTALAKELLNEEGVEYFLSEKLSQDPLEEHFGKQRGMGGRHENPDARQFGSNMQVLQVAGSCVSVSSRANVKRQYGRSPVKSKPLPKRQKKK